MSNPTPGKDKSVSEKTEKAPVAPSKTKKIKRKSIPEGHIYINATYNNTIITLAEPNGNVLAWTSAGACGFKGTRKATPFAAQTAAEKLAEKGKIYGLEKVNVFIKGIGTGREQALRGLNASGLIIKAILDRTPVPHNGCRARKARRV